MMMVRELEMIEHFRDLSLVCEVTSNSVELGMLKLTIGFLEEIKEKQRLDLDLVGRQTLVGQGNNKDFQIDDNGILKFRGRVCVSDVPEFKRMILEESHPSSWSIHPGSTKMYQDLKKMFWWSGMKRDIAQFCYSCLICQKSKVGHQRPSELMQPLNILE